MVAKSGTTSPAAESRDPEEPSTLLPASRSSEEQVFRIEESRKLGVISSMFLILNKMIGTGSELIHSMPWSHGIKSNRITQLAVFSTPSGIFASTGSVGLSLILWLIGELPHSAPTATIFPEC